MSVCSQCHKPVKNEWHFCPFCGGPVSRHPVSPVRPPVGHPLHGRRFFGDKPSDIVLYVKSSYPNHVVFVQNGFFWETYDEDARLCSSLFGWKVVDRGPHTEFTGVPTNAQRFKVRLREVGVSHVFIEQAEYPSPSKSVERVVGEVFTAPPSESRPGEEQESLRPENPTYPSLAPAPPEEGTQAGICLTCGNPIAPARLAFYPNARICVPCLDAGPTEVSRTCRRCGRPIRDDSQSRGRWGCTECDRHP